MSSKETLRDYLDGLVHHFNRREFIHTDPIGHLHNLKGNANREFAAFIISLFTFGTVKRIRHTTEALFQRIPRDVYRFILDFTDRRTTRFRGLKHRFIAPEDFLCIFNTMHVVANRYGTIESLFSQHHRSDATMKQAIIGFSKELRAIFRSCNRSFSERTLRFIFPSPSSGCAAKRMNLFLRWMVRNDRVDLGIWSRVQKSSLILPLDTHTARIAKHLGLTARKSPGWAMAQEITERLRIFDPEDPVKYDFALARLGMLSKGVSYLCEKYPAPPQGMALYLNTVPVEYERPAE